MLEPCRLLLLFSSFTIENLLLLCGAFLASIIIGMARSFGAVAMPLFTDGIMFLIMVLVLVIKPEGLMGKKK